MSHVTDSTEESFATTVLFLHEPSQLCTGMTNTYIFTINLSYQSRFILFSLSCWASVGAFTVSAVASDAPLLIQGIRKVFFFFVL